MPGEIEKLRTAEELDRAFESSKRRPLWLFKHSLACSVSSSAYAEFREFVEASPAVEGAPGFAVIEIQNARPLSAAVAERTGVAHESPQVLLLRDATVTWHASHWRITRRALEQQDA